MESATTVHASGTHAPGITSATASRALQLLGTGLAPSMVAATLGVTESRISQLLSQESFAEEVAKLRYASMQKHVARDAKYDSLEDALLARLENIIPFMTRPRDIVTALTAVNGAKRRSVSTQDSNTVITQQVVQLNMPVRVTQRFSVNINNQVIHAGEQSLVTIQASALEKLVSSPSREMQTGEQQQHSQEEITTPTQEQLGALSDEHSSKRVKALTELIPQLPDPTHHGRIHASLRELKEKYAPRT